MVRLRRDEHGAAAVELALVLLPLLLLLLGIVEFSRVFYTQLRLQQAAQQGVRQMALHYDDPGLDEEALADLVNDTLGDALGGVAVGDLSQILVSSTLCTVNTSTPQDARIILQDTVSIALPLDPITVTGRATMPCEG
jgi:Flp pilus assembly protein TadG